MRAISIKPPPFLRETHGVLRWLTARTCPITYCQITPANILYIQFPQNATLFENFFYNIECQTWALCYHTDPPISRFSVIQRAFRSIYTSQNHNLRIKLFNVTDKLLIINDRTYNMLPVTPLKVKVTDIIA